VKNHTVSIYISLIWRSLVSLITCELNFTSVLIRMSCWFAGEWRERGLQQAWRCRRAYQEKRGISHLDGHFERRHAWPALR